MKSAKNYFTTVFSTAVVTLLLVSLFLFWGRTIFRGFLDGLMPYSTRYISIRPSGLIEEKEDLNISPSSITAHFWSAVTLLNPSIRDQKLRTASKIYYQWSKNNQLYFDKKTGLIVYSSNYFEEDPNGINISREKTLYAGPKGVSEKSNIDLGRWLAEPLVTGRTEPDFILYDKKTGRFFKIDFENQTLTQGPDYSQKGKYDPIQIGTIIKNQSLLRLDLHPPMYKVKDEKGRLKDMSVKGDYKINSSGDMLLVLDRGGTIHLVDRQTLELVATAGRLPAPQTSFRTETFIKPKELSAYKVMPIANGTDKKYGGMCVAAVNRESTAMEVIVFDATGEEIKKDKTRFQTNYGDRSISDSRMGFYYGVPFAPASTIGLYLLENLQGPFFNILSYYTAGCFEATSSHRSLLVLPNSFVAMFGMERTTRPFAKFIVTVLIMIPSLILSVFLAFCVNKDTAKVGFSKPLRRCWFWTTILFGLVGYITYRVTRPKEVMVTCQNCGMLRRPDMQRCHQCKSTWQVAELIEPKWRVIG